MMHRRKKKKEKINKDPTKDNKHTIEAFRNLQSSDLFNYPVGDTLLKKKGNE